MNLSVDEIKSIQQKFSPKTGNESSLQEARSWTAKTFLKLIILKSIKRYNEAVGRYFNFHCCT